MADGSTSREGCGRIAGAFGLCLAVVVAGGIFWLTDAPWWFHSVNPALWSSVFCSWFGTAAALVVGTLIPGRKWSIGLPLVLLTQSLGACVNWFPCFMSSTTPPDAAPGVVAGVVTGIALLAYRPPLERLKWFGCLGIGLLFSTFIMLVAWQHDSASLSRVDTVMVPSINRMLAQDVLTTVQEPHWGRARWVWGRAKLFSPVCEVSGTIGKPTSTVHLTLDARGGTGVSKAGDLEGLNLRAMDVQFVLNARIFERNVRANPEIMRAWLRFVGFRPELVKRLSPYCGYGNSKEIFSFCGHYHGLNYELNCPDDYDSRVGHSWGGNLRIYAWGRYSSAEP